MTYPTTWLHIFHNIWTVCRLTSVFLLNFSVWSHVGMVPNLLKGLEFYTKPFICDFYRLLALSDAVLP